MGGVEEADGGDAESPLIRVRKLRKTFKTGLIAREVEAVRGVSFEVQRGEIVGFLGPNGSGKTTTIKMLLGLIKPTAGEAWMFGERVPSLHARQRLGFLPENPYVYPYLTPREFVRMSGALSGVPRNKLAKRTEDVLDRTGVLYAADRQVRRLSKGMLQRSALAAALVGDPELLILDEPMSGLDPVGRKEVRELILAECADGRTVFFSTHILSDVESLCDHVTILRAGQVVEKGPIRTLLRGDVVATDITLANAEPELLSAYETKGWKWEHRAEVVVVSVTGEAQLHAALAMALDSEASIVGAVPRRETLEDLFMRKALPDQAAQSSRGEVPSSQSEAVVD